MQIIRIIYRWVEKWTLCAHYETYEWISKGLHCESIMKGANKNIHIRKSYKWYLMCYLSAAVLVDGASKSESARLQFTTGHPLLHLFILLSQSWFTYEVINFWLMCDERHQWWWLLGPNGEVIKHENEISKRVFRLIIKTTLGFFAHVGIGFYASSGNKSIFIRLCVSGSLHSFKSGRV